MRLSDNALETPARFGLEDVLGTTCDLARYDQGSKDCTADAGDSSDASKAQCSHLAICTQQQTTTAGVWHHSKATEQLLLTKDSSIS